MTRTLLALVAAPLGACASGEQSPHPVSDGNLTEQVSQLLQTGTKWPNGQIPVCWDQAAVPVAERDPDFAVHAAYVQERARVDWGQLAKIDFTGWGTCPSNPQGTLVLHLFNDAGGCSSYVRGTHCQNDGAVGYPGSSSNRYVHFGPLHSDWVAQPSHEFGHVLGYLDEVDRAEAQSDPTCQHDHPPTSGNVLDTPFDNAGIMSATYCDPRGRSALSFWDVWGTQIFYGARTNPMVPMATAYNSVRQDWVTVSIGAGRTDTDAAGNYKWTWPGGWAFSVQAPGTVPLKLYWNNGRQDNVLVSTQAGINDANAVGYTFVRNEGYVYPTQEPGTVPLQLWWNNARQDNLTTASAQAQADAQANGYTFIRNEGYVFPEYKFASWIGPISEEQPDGVRCPGTGFGVRGAGCQGSKCDDMSLWCAPVQTSNGTLVETTPDDPSVWSSWISEETTAYQHNGHTVVGNTIACENSFGQPFANVKIIDGIRASGGNADDVSVHCATLASGHQLDPFSCAWTTAFSEEQAWQFFSSGKVAIGVRCTGSNCDNMSYYTCNVN